MAIIPKLQMLYICYFSKPQSNRPLYQAVYNTHARKIVELEIDDCQRAMRMIEVAKLTSPHSPVHYIGIDRFEDRDGRFSEVVLSLKSAYRLFRTTGAQVQLLPGDPPEVLPRVANFLGKVDLLILPEELDSAARGRMWFFIPRLLHEQTLVLIKRKAPSEKTAFYQKSHDDVKLLAGDGKRRAA